MGKKQVEETTITSAETFRIHKNKSLIANLSDYIKFLKNKHFDLTSKQYLSLVHKYITKMSKNKRRLPQNLIKKTTLMFKICKGCDKWAIGAKKMIECTLCEDKFHLDCAPKFDQKIKEWKCQSCLNVCKKIEKVNEQLQKAQEPPACSRCTENKNQLSIKCLKCCKYFHKSCYGKIFVVCKDCNQNIESKLKKDKQISLKQSFKRAQRNADLKKTKADGQQLNKNLKSKLIKKNVISSQKSKHQTKIQKPSKLIYQETQSSIIISSAKLFKSKFPEMTNQEIKKYKQNLLFAILSKNMEYTEDLQCQNCSLFQESNDSIDFTVEYLGFSDLKMFNQYKKQPIGPFLLKYKENCGYDVIADKDLPAGMIVCEYVGDVYTHRQSLNLLEENDSVMDIKNGRNADETLLIVPRKYTNIARFINGVNQKDKSRKKKENVANAKVLVQGRPAVILYTLRAIEKGESLMYNYGAGAAAIKYDTSNYL